MKKNKKHTILIIVALAIILGGLFFNEGISYAKYASQSIWDYYLKSKGFYFNSDYLSIDEQKNIDNLWDGNSVKFNLRNNLNQKIITEYDINYEVICEIIGEAGAHIACKLNGSESDTLTGVLSSISACKNTKNDGIDVSEYKKSECELGGYEWIYEIANNEIYFDIVKTDENYEINDIVIKIIASSTSPFKKTITGSFNLHKINSVDGEITMNYNDFSSYARLILTNTFETNKCVKLSWNPEKVVIDLNTEEYPLYVINENNYINEVKFNINSNDNKKFIYYKKDKLEVINKEDFIVEEIIECE